MGRVGERGLSLCDMGHEARLRAAMETNKTSSQHISALGFAEATERNCG